MMVRLSRVVLLGALLVGLALLPASGQIKISGSTPEDGAELDGPVRTVRVWFAGGGREYSRAVGAR